MNILTKNSAANADAPNRSAVPMVPFDSGRLDKLMDEAGIDVLLVTSKHNVQYLLGGYRFFFFDYMDAIGLSRYLPVFVYVKGSPIGRPTSRTRWKRTRRS